MSTNARAAGYRNHGGVVLLGGALSVGNAIANFGRELLGLFDGHLPIGFIDVALESDLRCKVKVAINKRTHSSRTYTSTNELPPTKFNHHCATDAQ